MGKMSGKLMHLRANWNRPSTDDNLSYKEIAGFTASAMGQDIFWSLRSYVKTVCISVFGIDPIKFGKLGLFSGIWDAVNDPIMGILIDRTDTKFGKLRPYMLFTALPIGIFMILSFYNPPFGATGKFIFISIIYIMWEMSYTISDVPFGALPSVITSNSVQRAKLITVSKYGSEIGLALPGLISFFVTIIGVQYMGQVFFVASIILSILGSSLFSVSFFTVKERVPPSPNKQSFSDMWKVLKSSKPMMILSISELMNTFSSAAGYASWFFFYYAFRGGIGWPLLKIFSSESEGLGLQALLSTLKGVPSFILMAFTPKLAKRFGMKTLVLISAAMSAFAYGSIYLVGYNSTPKLIYMIFVLALAGLPGNIIGVIRKTLSTDALDYVEWKTGERSEGLMGSILGFAIKLKDSLALFIGGYCLSWAGLAGAEDASEMALLQYNPNVNRLFMLYALIPAISAVLQGIPYLFYDFSGDKKQQIVEELQKTRAERREKLIAEGYEFDKDISVKDLIKKGTDNNEKENENY